MTNCWNDHTLAFILHHPEIEIQGHTSMQIVIGLNGNLKFEFEDDKTEAAGLLINQGVAYHFSSFQCCTLHLNIDARSNFGKYLKKQLLSKPYIDISYLIKDFLLKDHSEISKSDVSEILHLIAPEIKDYVRDERIISIVNYIQKHTFKKMDLEEIASKVALSADHVRHLFYQQTGVLFSQYLLWMRMKNVLNLLLREKIFINDAIGNSGFSDQSHFTHTFRKVFGITPFKIKNKAKLIN